MCCSESCNSILTFDTGRTPSSLTQTSCRETGRAGKSTRPSSPRCSSYMRTSCHSPRGQIKTWFCSVAELGTGPTGEVLACWYIAIKLLINFPPGLPLCYPTPRAHPLETCLQETGISSPMSARAATGETWRKLCWSHSFH